MFYDIIQNRSETLNRSRTRTGQGVSNTEALSEESVKEKVVEEEKKAKKGKKTPQSCFSNEMYADMVKDYESQIGNIVYHWVYGPMKIKEVETSKEGNPLVVCEVLIEDGIRYPAKRREIRMVPGSLMEDGYVRFQIMLADSYLMNSTKDTYNCYGFIPKLRHTVTIGKYVQNNNINNGEEEIEWEVLEVNDGKALLVSRYVLDVIPYNDEKEPAIWENCTLRKWLNEYFYNSAFSAEEKDRIISTHLINCNSDNISEIENDTDDMVFCLSVADMQKYYSLNGLHSGYYCENLLISPTKYASKKVECRTFEKSDMDFITNTLHYSDAVIGKKASTWWLRTPGYESNKVAFIVDSNGSLGNKDVNNIKIGVRPAMWISLE